MLNVLRHAALCFRMALSHEKGEPMTKDMKTVVAGVIVWGLVVVLMRVFEASVFSPGSPWLVVFYILCFPLGLAFTPLMSRVLGVPVREMLRPLAILTIVAIVLDGLAFAFTDIYGVGAHEVYSAAFLLWAPGIFLLCGLWLVDRAAGKAGASDSPARG
jgi:hypothetical protein